jgi:hypothetical protein
MRERSGPQEPWPSYDSRAMTRAVVWTGVRVVLSVAIGVAAAAGLAALRGGPFSDQFRTSLWIVGGLMLVLTISSLSPSTRHGQGEMSNVFLGRRFLGSDERGGAGVTVVLALSAFVIFGIALLVG